jgi:predicted hydrocarbon binding protein
MPGERYAIPNKWARTILLVAQPMMSASDFESALASADLSGSASSYPPDNMKKGFSFEQMSRLQERFRAALGASRMEELGIAAGAQIVADSLSQFTSVAAAAKIAMKVGSPDGKVKLGLEFFSKFFTSVSDEKIASSSDSSYWTWTVSRCAQCWGRQSHEPVCPLAVGMVRGVLNWISPETQFDLRESECIANGGRSCVILIAKQY